MQSNHFILCPPPLLPPSIFPSIRFFSNESVIRMRWPKYRHFSFSISPSYEYSGMISFWMDWFDLLAVQGILKSLLQHYSSKPSILRCSGFFIAQLSYSYMTTGKTIALTRWTLVGKVVSQLFNMLSRLVMVFLLRSKCILISWMQSQSAVILVSKKIKSVTVSPSISHEMMGSDATILAFWMLSFKPTFSLPSFTFTKRLFSSSLLFAIRVVSSAYQRLLMFLLAILIPACASFSPVFLMMYSAYKLNKQGDNIEPWCTPFPSWNQSAVPCPLFLDLLTGFSGGRSGGFIFPSLEEISLIFRSTESKALA